MIISCLLVSASLNAAKLPTEDEIKGVERLCAGGRTYSFSAGVSAALRNWRMGSVNASANTAIESLGSVIARIPHDATDSRIYSAYTSCVVNLIDKFLNTADPNKPRRQQTILDLVPDYAQELPSTVAIVTRSDGMTAENATANSSLYIWVVPDYDSSNCPVRVRHALAITRITLETPYPPGVVRRVTLTNEPTGRIGTLELADVRRQVRDKFEALRREMGNYGGCIKLDDHLHGDINIGYTDYEGSAKQAHFSFDIRGAIGSHLEFFSERKTSAEPIEPIGTCRSLACEASAAIYGLTHD
jgi:hypothetical protein